jgi:hypothetical protein
MNTTPEKLESDPTWDDQTSGGRPLLGSILVFSATAVLLLLLIDLDSQPPLDLPSSWTEHRRLWFCIAAAAFVGGCMLLKNRSQVTSTWSPTRPGRRFTSVVVYTREGCHLCDQAIDTLLKYRPYLPSINEIDIDTDSDLVERFHDVIPVVEFDGSVRFRGQVDEVLLRRLIEGTPPLESS